MPAADIGFSQCRKGPCHILLRDGIPCDPLLDAIQNPGELLKQSHKTTTRRVHNWVIKESRFQHGAGPLKMTFLREKYRRAWRAAVHLEQQGINVAAPIAWLEWTALGAILKNCCVSTYLHGCRNVEQYAATMLNADQKGSQVPQFLERLANAVNKLIDAGVCHTDLSGKNIFTSDGQSFWFIDLDGVIVGRPSDDKQRKMNHIQLYDSFCDLFDPAIMAEFVAAMMPPNTSTDAWLNDVREGQKARRARYYRRRDHFK